jgi:hypothetical protein
MIDPQVTLDSATLNPVEEKLQGALEDQLTSALQAAVEEISSGYAGQSVDEVTAALLTTTKSHLHPDIADGWVPDHAQLHEVAAALVRDAA